MDTQSSGPDRGTGPVHTVLSGIVWIGRAAAWLIVPILILVLVSVTFSAAKFGTIVQWENDVFLFGSKLTLSSLGDLQWHLFGIMLMLTMAGALVNDAHVRVDFLRQNMSERQKNIVDLIGHIVFLMPLCIIVVLHGYDFTLRSFTMGEGSNYDGMYDRFVLKAFIPIGFALMLVAGIGLIVVRLQALFKMGRGKVDD
ncbi:Tripartite ATP-independent periplasmic transporters, DctQ component [Roseovarius litorisediminis]|uniref:TRAP transporter small permease protein n=1 Tax=Roseovarius litorisediminis TaxID=1312363 RepID=A0A1Y5R788_9RHOB|nr:TRAP transporter small permease subunit [Roseovarius litorisediminis]SLN10825.1 Tripartite ATP-independent periplasmic transporters, DctQ component [Roseovarius litorisediminis]